VALRADRQTASFQALYRRRAPVIEGIFAEAKQWHGLRRAWRRGLGKMRIQCLLIAAVLNFKRLVRWLGHTLGFRPMQRAYPMLWRGLVTFLVNITRQLFTDMDENPVHGYTL
jgi:hypothetical protein